MSQQEPDEDSSSDSICASTDTASGDPCQCTPTKPDGRCYYHSEHGTGSTSWKFTEEFRETFIEQLKAGLYIKDAAEECGVSVESVRGWLEKGRTEDSGVYAEFADAFDKHRPDKSISTTSKFTPSRRDAVLERLRGGDSIRQAADAAGIDGATLHAWIQKSLNNPDGRYGDFAAEVIDCYSHDLSLFGGEYPSYIDPDTIESVGSTRGYRGPNWYTQRRKTLERDGYTCRHCGMDSEDHIDRWGGELHVHHIRPRSSFESEDDPTMNYLSNLVTLCHWCHAIFEGTFFAPVHLDNHDRRREQTDLRGRQRERRTLQTRSGVGTQKRL
jgi:transposase-like protein